MFYKIKVLVSPPQMQTAFKSSVEHLCESWVAQSGGVAVEPQLLKAAVMLGLYVKKKSPDLSAVVQGAMATFINTNLANWVFQQGGWVGNKLMMASVLALMST